MRLAYLASQLISRCLLGYAGRRRVLHAERAQRAGAWILAANHISHFDPLVLTSVVRRQIDWMAMAELFRSRLLGAWLRASDTFPVERGKADRASLRTAIERLRGGKVVGIFPEGGLRDGAESVLGGAALRGGIRLVAQLGDAPIVPCVILGSDRLYRAANWLPMRRVPIWIGCGEALDADAGEEKLADSLRAIAVEMRAHFQLTDDDLPKPPHARMQGR